MSAASAPLTVAADPSASPVGDALLGIIGAVVASLPISLAHAEAGGHGRDADLIAIDGAPGWGERASLAARRGARGVVVIDPIRSELVDPGDTLVVVERAFASHPGVDDARRNADHAGHGALVEIRMDVPRADGPESSLLDALALARAVTGQAATDARIITLTPHQLVVRGMLATTQPVLVTVTATDARPHAARVRLLGPESALEVEVPSAAAARPACVTVTGADGATLLPTRYETAHRGSWRRLIAALSAPDTTSLPDLEELADDGVVVDRALHEHPLAAAR